MKVHPIFNFKFFLGFIFLSIYGILLIIVLFYALFGDTPIYDYEGFSLEKILLFIPSIFTFIYLLKKEKPLPTIKEEDKQWSIKSTLILIVGLALVFVVVLNLFNGIEYFDKDLKYSLPLKTINTSILEGETKRDITISQDKAFIKSVKLKKYPNILFRYVKEKNLKSRLLIQPSDFEIPKGSAVQLKIRASDFEDLSRNAPSKSRKSSRTNQEEYVIPFYGLTYQDTLIFEKMGIK